MLRWERGLLFQVLGQFGHHLALAAFSGGDDKSPLGALDGDGVGDPGSPLPYHDSLSLSRLFGEGQIEVLRQNLSGDGDGYDTPLSAALHENHKGDFRIVEGSESGEPSMGR